MQAGVSPERIRELADKMRSYEQDLLAGLASLVSIPSFRQAPQADAPYGAGARDVLLSFLQLAGRLGFRTGNLANRAGYAEFGSGEKMIAVLCHLDVVPAGAGWQSNPFQLHRIGDHLIGRGTSDNKGPALAVLYAMKDLLDKGYPAKSRIRLIVGTDEENGSSCLAHYARVAELPAAGFTPDSSFPVVYAEKGHCQLKIKARASQAKTDQLKLVAAEGGEAANVVARECKLSFCLHGEQKSKLFTGTGGHGGMPLGLENAISKAMQYAAKELSDNNSHHAFVDLYNRLIGSDCLGAGLGIAISDDSGPLTVNTGLLSLAENEAEVTIDIRYPVTADFSQIWKIMQKRVAEAGGQIELIKHSPALHVAEESALVQTLSQVYSELTGHRAEPISSAGGTYAKTMPNVVAFGAGLPGCGGNVHQADEFITLTGLLALATIYQKAIVELADLQQ